MKPYGKIITKKLFNRTEPMNDMTPIQIVIWRLILYPIVLAGALVLTLGIVLGWGTEKAHEVLDNYIPK